MDKTEITHLAISVLTISIAFSLAYLNLLGFTADFLEMFGLIFLTVGIGFIAHEMGHRMMAKQFGCKAKYVMWTQGLFLALIMALITKGQFIFAAPGAVYIYKQNLTMKENGLISLAGPMVNIILALVFFFAFSGTKLGIWGFNINIFLALFNLIPFGPLDGRKVMQWNGTVWAIFFIPLCIVFYFLRFYAG